MWQEPMEKVTINHTNVVQYIKGHMAKFLKILFGFYRHFCQLWSLFPWLADIYETLIKTSLDL